jgi:glucose uptake protein GlcU
MTETIGFTASVVLGVSELVLLSSFVLAVDREREREDEDDDKVFNAYITVLKVSSVTFVLSWLTLVIVAIVESIIK